ncbi:MAG TPA: 50S ribosomal protein L11 methyltransferase [Burkholderiales bacterium]|nr:50S ribosomal protein L11 methyltransferase [Burkholderiales bacterium]
MNWLSVSFEIGASEVEAITDALLAAGALAVDVEDAHAGSEREEPLFAEGVEAPGTWRLNVVRALLAAEADPGAVVAAACAVVGVPAPPHTVEVVPDQDWVRATQAQFHPIQITSRLWIVPSWHPPPDPKALNVTLDPGLAFGTGNHATTRLCLRWLARTVAGRETVIDYGCGSGILAIAAMKLGAASATGIDIDEQALLAARGNAIQNRVHVEFRAAADRAGRSADIVVANILAHPLIVLAPVLAGLTAPRGSLALAGILASQVAEVRAAYGEWFDLVPDSEEENWVLLAGVRK